MTALPLRPDGGVDLVKLDPESKDQVLAIISATLERVTKWREGRMAELEIMIDAASRMNLLYVAKGFAASHVAHQQSVAAISAMKP